MKTLQVFISRSRSAHTWLICAPNLTVPASIKLQCYEDSGHGWVVCLFLIYFGFLRAPFTVVQEWESLSPTTKASKRSGHQIHYHRWACLYKGIKQHPSPSTLQPPASHDSYLRYPTTFHRLTRSSSHVYYTYLPSASYTYSHNLYLLAHTAAL